MGVHLVSLQIASFKSGLSLLLLGPSPQGTQVEAAALCSECFPPCLLSRQRGPEYLLTLQVSLSFFYSWGLNKGFGCPGLGENGCLPSEPPFFPGSRQSPLSLLSPSGGGSGQGLPCHFMPLGMWQDPQQLCISVSCIRVAAVTS